MQTTYSSDRKSATVTPTCRQQESVKKVEFNYNGEGYTSDASYHVDSSFDKELTLEVKATDGDGKEFIVTVQPQNFVCRDYRPPLVSARFFDSAVSGYFLLSFFFSSFLFFRATCRRDKLNNEHSARCTRLSIVHLDSLARSHRMCLLKLHRASDYNIITTQTSNMSRKSSAVEVEAGHAGVILNYVT